MDFLDLIEKKKQGKSHTKEEIYFIVDSYSKEKISDAQMAAWLMAVSFNSLTTEETAILTEALAKSGKTIEFGEVSDLIVDKHSTGGVGDNVTITLIPLLAAAGIPMAKLADRGLGYAAGTIDKLEAIPGFRTSLSEAEVINQLKDVKAVISSQAEDLAPADRKLHALRNTTGTIDSDVLIASSILSKKIASGASKILLDIKYGSGAFMKTAEDAVFLSRMMVNIAQILNKSVIAFVTSMEEPLGRAIGNSLEVIEAIEFLKGNIKTGDLAELTYCFAKTALVSFDIFDDVCEADKFLKELVQSGKALEKFKELITAQGGDIGVIDNYDKFELPAFKIECESKKSGYVQNIDAHKIALAGKALGINRELASNIVDHSVGIYLSKKSGEYVNKGENLYIIYSNDEEKTKLAQKFCDEAFSINETKPAHSSLIYSIIGNSEEEDNDV